MGNTDVASALGGVAKDHPHLRGEYLVAVDIFLRHKGSPPLAWGIQRPVWRSQRPGRITPTCVGNTHGLAIGDVESMDHPHLRGEYRSIVLFPDGYMGSPPLAWGILRKAPYKKLNLRITPTCVGNTSPEDGAGSF